MYFVYLSNSKAFNGTGREIHTERKTGLKKHVHTYAETSVISLETVMKCKSLSVNAAIFSLDMPSRD